jgi:hypothetical protein
MGVELSPNPQRCIEDNETDSAPLPSLPIATVNPGNVRGDAMERIGASLLSSLPYIAETRITEKHGPEDIDGKDIITVFSADQSKVPTKLLPLVIYDAHIQIKASSTVEFNSRKTLSRRLKRQGIYGADAIKEWKLQNRYITLIVDLKSSRSGNTRRKVTAKEFIGDYEAQLYDINEYAKSHTPRTDE